MALFTCLIVTVLLLGKTDGEVPPNYVTKDMLVTEYLAEDKCKLNITQDSLDNFRHNVFLHDLNFVYLNLTYHEPDIAIKNTRLVVQPTIWVWTFYSNKGQGALEFLRWPIEFGIWSMDLLSQHVQGPMNMHLKRIGGNCSNLTVGERKSDLVVATALASLPDILTNLSYDDTSKYGSSFWCYKQRMLIKPHYIYILCKHIVCPMEALEYSCCGYFYNTTLQRRNVSCLRNSFIYDSLLYTVPALVAFIIFAFSPLLVFHLANRVNETLKRTKNKYVFVNEHFPETLCGAFCSPFTKYFSNYSTCFYRSLRMGAVLATFSFIILQNMLDTTYLLSFVVSSVKKGVPMGFRSIAAGYNESKHNFLPLFGGPYVALAAYFVLATVFIVLPKSLSHKIEMGLPAQNSSALNHCMQNIERFGSVKIGGTNCYLQAYYVELGQFYMVLNIKYWKYLCCSKVDRWNTYYTSTVQLILLPAYVIFCIIEILIGTIFYSIPIVSSSVFFTRCIYYALPEFRISNRNIKKTIFLFVSAVLLIAVVFFEFMFCIIFMDASLFLTRVFAFTYTGMLVNPENSYGYFIFFATGLFYFWDIVNEYAFTYQKLLKDSIIVCEKIVQRTDFLTDRIVVKRDGFKGLDRNLYEFLVERQCPRRLLVFKSLLKLVLIVTSLGFTLSLLLKVDRLGKLTSIMHIFTVVFTVAVPVIIKSICVNTGSCIQTSIRRRRIKKDVKEYIEHF